jgi:hypothetical protein
MPYCEVALRLGIVSQRYRLATGSDKAMPHCALYCNELEDFYQGLDLSCFVWGLVLLFKLPLLEGSCLWLLRFLEITHNSGDYLSG